MSRSEDRRTEIALFRYTLILPLLRGEHPPGGKQRLREQIASRHYDIPYASRSTVSPATLARWERRYRQAGFDGLKPQPRSDRGTPRAISPATLDRAETLKREQPRRSARSIIKMLSLDQTNPIPEDHLAPRTLRRHLAARDATTAQLHNAQRPKPYRRFERPHFGDLWQGDAMHGPYLPDPAHPGQQRQVFLFAFIDDHTRLVPHAQFYWNEQLPRMEDCLQRAIRRHGRPLAIYVDRAQIYASKQLDTVCATLGMQRILGTPYYPEGRGKIERLFEFVQSDFLPELASPAASAATSVTTLQQLNVSFLAWLEVIYHRKVHSETGQAPLERARQDPAPTTRPVDPELLRQAFLHRADRQVTKMATISFSGNRYTVPAYLRGQRIQLRYDPFDLTRLEIWYQDTFLQLAAPETLVATHHPDVELDPLPPPPQSAAIDYLALLRLEHERLLQAELDTIHFSQLTALNPKETPADDDSQ